MTQIITNLIMQNQDTLSKTSISTIDEEESDENPKIVISDENIKNIVANERVNIAAYKQFNVSELEEEIITEPVVNLKETESIHSFNILSEDDKFEDSLTDLPPERPSQNKIELLSSEHVDEKSPTPKKRNLKIVTVEADRISIQKSNRDKDNFEYSDSCDICKYFRVVGNEIFHNHAQEPWPKDVRLFQPYEVEQILLPDNANCLAVQTFLKMCNLDFKVDPRPNAEAMSPTGKVPFIKCGAFIVAQLEGIVQFVASKGISLTNDLTHEQKSDMRAYLSLIDNVLGNAELYICWCDNETYNEVTKPRYGSIYPWPLNYLQTWSKRNEEMKQLKVRGWYPKSLEDVYQEVETCCQALTDRLDGNDYFFGSKFTELDAIFYAHFFLMLTIPLPAHLGLLVKKYGKLVSLCKRIDVEIMGNNSDLSPKSYKRGSNIRRVSFGAASGTTESGLSHIIRHTDYTESNETAKEIHLKEDYEHKNVYGNSNVSINVKN